MRRFDAKQLENLMPSTLAAHGAASDSIRHVVASLVQTSLRGVDSHGINLFPHYCKAVSAGRVNGTPNIQIELSGNSTALVDADHAFGHHSGAVAMEQALLLAQENGIGAVSVRNSTHFGAAAYFAMMAPAKECIGLAFTNADALVKAFGAREPFFGTNPVCFAAPMASEGPFCLDMATSLVSWNKIKNYRRTNVELMPEWACNADGLPVTDPHEAMSLNPAGGYKGFGLGMMVDILCALLAGGKISKDLRPMYEPPLDSNKRGISHFFMALDISRFTDPQLFKQTLQSMAARIRALTPLDATEPVMIAGDPEKKSFIVRSREGIPVDDATYHEYLSLNPKFAEALVS